MLEQYIHMYTWVASQANACRWRMPLHALTTMWPGMMIMYNKNLDMHAMKVRYECLSYAFQLAEDWFWFAAYISGWTDLHVSFLHLIVLIDPSAVIWCPHKRGGGSPQGRPSRVEAAGQQNGFNPCESDVWCLTFYWYPFFGYQTLNRIS